MARSMRNDAKRQAAPNVEQSLRLLADLAVCEEDSFVEPGLALDTLNFGDAGLRDECWLAPDWRRRAAPPKPAAEAYAVTSVETATTGGSAIHPG